MVWVLSFAAVNPATPLKEPAPEIGFESGFSECRLATLNKSLVTHGMVVPVAPVSAVD
jgi:hypothetical protein